MNDMDNMRISGTENSSVILSKTKKFKKLKSDTPKVLKQGKAKWDGVINHKITISINSSSQNATNQPRSTVELG